MAIAYRSQASLPNASRTTTTVNMPAGVAAGDVVLVFCATGASAEIAITPPASLSSNPVANRSYNDTSPPWTVNMRIYRYTVAGSGDPASFAFTHASSASEALAIAFSGVDTTTPIDATPTTNSGLSTTATLLGLTTTVDAAWLVAWRGSWDGNAIAPPAGWTERLDQPVTWVAHREQAIAGATGDFSIPSGNSGAYPYGGILIPLRPAGGGPSPITGTLTASTPAPTVGPPTSSVSGSVAVPVYSGDLAASTPAVAAGPPTSAISGTVTTPTYNGTLDASTPTMTAGPPTSSITGTVTAPGATTGTLAADLPTVTAGPLTMAASGTVTVPTYAGELAASTAALTVGPPTVAWTGTSAPPTYSGTPAASTPSVTVGPPTADISGTVVAPGANQVIASLPTVVIAPPSSTITGTTSPPVYAGSIAATLPQVSIGPPAAFLLAFGTTSVPAVTGTLAASLPTITVGPVASTIFDSSIPPLPTTGVSLTVSAGTRGLSVTTEARDMEVTT